MMTLDATQRARLADLWRLNRRRYLAAGWRLGSYLALPRLATLTALFPPDPTEWAPDAGLLPLLPRQAAVQRRLDTERAPQGRRPVGQIRVPAAVLAEPKAFGKTRKVSTHRIPPRPLVLRDGFWVEPLTHHAYGNRRHYRPRVGKEA